MSRAEHAEQQRERVAAEWEIHGTVMGVARAMKLTRSTVLHHLKKLRADGKCTKPLAGGSLLGIQQKPAELPPKGQVKRYILTSAQNNTKVNTRVWNNLVALAEHYDAEILVGTYSYNTNAYGKLAVKRGTEHTYQNELWYDERLRPFFADERRELAKGLVWCGEMNVLPTAEDPLEGLETYSGRQSAIFPHAKMSLRSIAAMKNSYGTKLNFTTGTVTQRNYIQKKAGLKGEHHHIYGAVLVEVNSDGNWWVRQLEADDKGRIYDLDLLVENEEVTPGNRVEAINWGDHHFATIDGTVTKAALGESGMLETLRPRFQFHHDVMEGVWTNHHGAKDPHDRFKAFLRGFDTVQAELETTAGGLAAYNRPWAQSVVVDSNHDGDWIYRWLKEHDYRRDPRNAVLFLELQLAVYKAMERRDKTFHLTEFALRMQRKTPANVRFLKQDESFTIANRRIECGMHGHLGPDGARGTPSNLNKIGRRANTGHTHSAEIRNGLYVAGTSTTLDMATAPAACSGRWAPASPRRRSTRRRALYERARSTASWSSPRTASTATGSRTRSPSTCPTGSRRCTSSPTAATRPGPSGTRTAPRKALAAPGLLVVAMSYDAVTTDR
jgi:hypothetical protein